MFQDIVNDRNLTALDLCKNNPRPEWEECAKIVSFLNKNK